MVAKWKPAAVGNEKGRRGRGAGSLRSRDGLSDQFLRDVEADDFDVAIVDKAERAAAIGTTDIQKPSTRVNLCLPAAKSRLVERKPERGILVGTVIQLAVVSIPVEKLLLFELGADIVRVRRLA